MQISIIDNFEQFNRLKEDWDAVYSADPYTTSFVSWAWQRGWCEVTPYKWIVLAIRPEGMSSYVAFMTFGRSFVRKFRFVTIDCELHLGGHPLSCHTGFVCLPEYTEQVISAIAAFIQNQIKWDRFFIREMFDPRLDIFLRYFSHKNYRIDKMNSTPCPYIPLPASWEQYLRDFLSNKTIKRIKYYLRRIERVTDFRITQIQADNYDKHIDIFLSLHRLRWPLLPEQILNSFRVIFQRCFENHCLWLPILWNGTRPIAAMAVFIDRKKRNFFFYSQGWDDKFAKLSPGKVIVAYSIKYAIENGFRIYDFLRGDEEYKYYFGAINRFNTNITITRKNPRITVTAVKNIRRFRRLQKDIFKRVFRFSLSY